MLVPSPRALRFALPRSHAYAWGLAVFLFSLAVAASPESPLAGPRRILGHFALNLCLGYGLNALLRWPWVRALFPLLLSPAPVALLAYRESFGQAPSLYHLLGLTLAETGSAAGALTTPPLLPLWAVALGFSLLLAGLGATSATRPPRRQALSVALVSLGAFLVGVEAFTRLAPRDLGLRSREPSGEALVFRVGLAGTWWLEATALVRGIDWQEVLIARNRAPVPPFPDARLVRLQDQVVLVQVESLGDWLPRRLHRGEPIMPFLHSLWRRGLYWRMEAIHDTNSTDTDFTVITGLRPPGIRSGYRAPGLRISKTLPRIARRAGYRSHLYHGNDGNFLRRRAGVAPFGFDSLWFDRELESAGLPLRPGAWRLADHDVFRFVSRRLRQTPDERALHYLITLQTHTPFPQRPFYPSDFSDLSPRGFWNGMRYVDNHLGELVRSVSRPTTFLIFGDHEPPLGPRLRGPRRFKREFVPLFIVEAGKSEGAEPSAWSRPGTRRSTTLRSFARFLQREMGRKSQNLAMARKER